MIWILAIGTGLAGLLLIAALRSWCRSHGGYGRVCVRYWTGLPLDGQRRTDAGTLRRGLHAYTRSGRATWWAHLPHAYRAGIRWAATLGPITVAWGLLMHPGETLVTLAAAAVVALALGGWAAYRAAVRWHHRRRLERPLATALAPILSVTPQVAESALSVSRRYAESKGSEQVATLGLPDHFHADGDQTLRAERLFESRLGIDCRFTWRMSKTPFHVEVRRAPVPPDKVPLAEVRAAIDSCAEGKVVLGKDANGDIFYGDFLNEDPHWGVSAGSRRGKTTMLCLVAAQLLRQGAERVTGIDPKMISLDPLVGVPRVDIHNDPRNVQGMWDAIANFRGHMDGRMDAYSQDKTLEFKRSLLIVDEINQFAAMSLSYWRSIKEKGDPALPPVWADLAAIAWQGAQLKCNMIVVGQRLDSAATGGQGLRDSFGIRMLAGYTPQQWGFLVGTHPIPRSQKPRGRFIVINGGDHTWVQFVWGTPQEIRDLAMEPTRTAADAPTGAPTGSDAGEGSGEDPTPLPVRYGLKQASTDEGAGIIPMRYEAMKKARQTDTTFPVGRATPQGTKYTAEELREWYVLYSSRKQASA